jgi:hypothetical protein
MCTRGVVLCADAWRFVRIGAQIVKHFNSTEQGVKNVMTRKHITETKARARSVSLFSFFSCAPLRGHLLLRP